MIQNQKHPGNLKQKTNRNNEKYLGRAQGFPLQPENLVLNTRISNSQII